MIRRLSQNQWSIDWTSGHCVLDDQVHAYIDSQPGANSSLRVVGPYTQGIHSPKYIQHRMLDLTNSLEASEESSGRFVCWGMEAQGCETTGETMVVLGSSLAFRPNYLLRTLLVALANRSEQRDMLRREWTVDIADGGSVLRAFHRLGFSLTVYLERARLGRICAEVCFSDCNSHALNSDSNAIGILFPRKAVERAARTLLLSSTADWHLHRGDELVT